MSDHYDRYNGMENLLSTNLASLGTDCISREQAIDAIGKKSDEIYKTKQDGATFPHDDLFQGMAYAADIIKTLPSAQPEIIHCKECKWYGRADKRRFYRGMDCLQKRIDTIIPDKDFCSRAERRTDD